MEIDGFRWPPDTEPNAYIITLADDIFKAELAMSGSKTESVDLRCCGSSQAPWRHKRWRCSPSPMLFRTKSCSRPRGYGQVRARSGLGDNSEAQDGEGDHEGPDELGTERCEGQQLHGQKSPTGMQAAWRDPRQSEKIFPEGPRDSAFRGGAQSPLGSVLGLRAHLAAHATLNLKA